MPRRRRRRCRSPRAPSPCSSRRHTSCRSRWEPRSRQTHERLLIICDKIFQLYVATADLEAQLTDDVEELPLPVVRYERHSGVTLSRAFEPQVAGHVLQLELGQAGRRWITEIKKSRLKSITRYLIEHHQAHSLWALPPKTLAIW